MYTLAIAVTLKFFFDITDKAFFSILIVGLLAEVTYCLARYFFGKRYAQHRKKRA